MPSPVITLLPSKEPSSSSAAGDKAHEANNKNHGKMSKLQIALLILLGVCFLINAIVNLSHAHGPDLHPQAALHRAMDEFKHGFVLRKTKANNNNADSFQKSIANVMARIKDEEPVIKSDADNNNAKNPPAADNNNDLKTPRGESEIAKLSCEKYGGPSDEDSQEMVYWSDVPSDSLYVSPLKKKLKKGERRYMTFEPDGGYAYRLLFVVVHKLVLLYFVFHVARHIRFQKIQWVEQY